MVCNEIDRMGVANAFTSYFLAWLTSFASPIFLKRISGE